MDLEEAAAGMRRQGGLVKSLILLRHGKSDWSADTGVDHDRPISRRGQRAATAVGEFLVETGHVPDLVLCSPAVRSRQTVELAALPAPVEFADDLYDLDGDVLGAVRQTDDAVDVLMLVGHEPTFSELTHLLIGGGNHRVPTAALVRIELGVDSWTEIQPAIGQLEWLIPARLLTDTVTDSESQP